MVIGFDNRGSVADGMYAEPAYFCPYSYEDISKIALGILSVCPVLGMIAQDWHYPITTSWFTELASLDGPAFVLAAPIFLSMGFVCLAVEYAINAISVATNLLATGGALLMGLAETIGRLGAYCLEGLSKMFSTAGVVLTSVANTIVTAGRIAVESGRKFANIGADNGADNGAGDAKNIQRQI